MLNEFSSSKCLVLDTGAKPVLSPAHAFRYMNTFYKYTQFVNVLADTSHNELDGYIYNYCTYAGWEIIPFGACVHDI